MFFRKQYLSSNSQIKKELYRLTGPIFIDIALVMLLGAVDTVMLSRYSDDAVAAVGLDNQIISFVFLIYQFVSMGAAILCAQYFGAGLRKRFIQVLGLGLGVNALLAFILSSAMWLWADDIVQAFGIREHLLKDGIRYLQITGSLSFFQAISLTITAGLRSVGKTVKPMLATVVVNILNIVGNYALIFGHFGCPAMGVEGAAWATAGSRIAATLILLCFLPNLWPNSLYNGTLSTGTLSNSGLSPLPLPKEGRGMSRLIEFIKGEWFHKQAKHISPLSGEEQGGEAVVGWGWVSYFRPFPWQELRNLLKVGIPAMTEEMSYSLSQLTIMFFINQISTESLTTKVYCTTAITFVILMSCSIVQGGAIMVGHYVGQLRYRAAYILGNYVVRMAMTATLVVALPLALGGHFLMQLLTDNKEIIYMGTIIFIIDWFLNIGRVKNIFACGTLRAAGDVVYAVVVGITVQWTVAVGVAWFLGIPMGYGLIGIWIGFCLDENIRGIILMRRWHSQRWRGKSFTAK